MPLSSEVQAERECQASHLSPSPRGRAAGVLGMYDTALAARDVGMLLAMEAVLVNVMLLSIERGCSQVSLYETV